MKKTALFSVSLLLASAMLAQPGKTTASKAPVPVLKNMTDSVSYAIGLSVANFYKQQGIKNINGSLVTRAVNEVIAGKKTLFDETVANTVMNQYMSRMQEEKSKPVIEAGQKFLAQNKLKPGVKMTASGLQYEVIIEGTGIKPTAVDTFVCHYRGTFLDGKEFDASYNRGQPLVYPVSQVIAGWQEGLQLMSVGSKYKLYIPHTIGYGAFDYNTIPGGSMLIFELELLDVKKGQPK
ncbi:MAG: FKBP-type peptidyl-prolyl cis-trans isomerase N-terminal domain-containing protein [Bacteroidota bacterium]